MSRERNPELATLHRDLIDLADRLAERQEHATSPAEVRAIGREITEVTHRVTIVGQLLFSERTERIRGAAEAVAAGKSELDAAIAQIEKLNAFLKTMSKFLSLVDKVVDLAKLI